VASRLVIVALGIIGVATLIDQHTATVAGAAAAFNLETVWNKWDAVWYQRIATHGYTYQLDDIKGQAAAAYFPLYPLTVRLILSLVPSLSFFWVATILSNLATMAALWLIAREIIDRDDRIGRVMAVMMTSAGSFYLSIPYTEGLFLLFVVGTIVLTRRRQYEAAGLVAGLAATTRVHGLALIAIPVFACWLDATAASRARWTRAGLTLAAFAIPVAIFLAYEARVLGSPFAFLTQQEKWNNPSPYPFQAVVGLFEFPRRIGGWIHGAWWVFYVALLLRYWRTLPIGEVLFCAGVLVISTQQESFQGIYRYMVPLIPLTLAIARDRDGIRYGVMTLNVILGVLMLLAFVTNNRLTV
jgi:Gpi18-like mannosyltransferase